MSAFVLDCSVGVSWFFEDEQTAETQALLERVGVEGAVVPALWMIEVANAIAMGERRRRLRPGTGEAILAQLRALDIEIDSAVGFESIGGVLALCREHGLTAYDAVYLELARRRALPLATLDKALKRAAKAMRVDVV